MRQKRGTPGHKTLLNILTDGRIAAGLTQVELAARLKVRQSYVSNYETGERRLDAIELILVCRAIGLAPSGVIDRVDEVVAVSPPGLIPPKRASQMQTTVKQRKGPRKRKR
jgi:transcriptional regulator with XRE-family HTH domain